MNCISSSIVYGYVIVAFTYRISCKLVFNLKSDFTFPVTACEGFSLRLFGLRESARDLGDTSGVLCNDFGAKNLSIL